MASWKGADDALKPITVAPDGKGFFVFHTALKWNVAGPFRLLQDANAEVKKRQKAFGVRSWSVQLKDLKGPKDKRDPALMLAVEQLAALLQETKEKPIECLTYIITVCGLAFAEAVFKETMEVEATGGLPVSGVRRAQGFEKRTRGGTFFHLARQKMTPEQQARIIPWERQKKGYARWQATRQGKKGADPMGGGGTPPAVPGGG